MNSEEQMGLGARDGRPVLSAGSVCMGPRHKAGDDNFWELLGFALFVWFVRFVDHLFHHGDAAPGRRKSLCGPPPWPSPSRGEGTR